MSIYRRRNKNGKRQKYYTAEFTYRGVPYRKGGFVDREHAKDWLNTEQLRLRRRATGFVKPLVRAQVGPLIDRFTAKLAADGRDEMYVYTSGKRLHRLAAECGWVILEHVTAESLDSWKVAESRQDKRRKPIGDRTKRQYVQLAQEWGTWLKKPAGVLPSNPLEDVTLPQAKHNDAYRRAATLDELNALLATCPVERRACYVFRVYHASMRRRVMRGLTWRMMRLDANPPFAMVPAELNKSRRDTKYVLRFEVAQELRAERKRSKAKADDLVFPRLLTVDDLRADLAAAGVKFEHAKDYRRLDFHAFRKTLVKLAKAAGLSLDDAGLLLGHKTSATTKKYYDDDAVDPDLGAAMERLPTLGKLRKAE